MKRQLPNLITRRHVIRAFYPPDGCTRWHAQLPAGPLVFLGREADEVHGNLDALNRLAAMCRNRFRGVAALTLEQS
jgi:hypothetical protein